jgi:ribosome maturation factor RimP
VERPLVRRRDFERFAGQEVALRGKDALAGRARRLEGTLVGLAGDGEGKERVVLRLPGGEEVEIPREHACTSDLSLGRPREEGLLSPRRRPGPQPTGEDRVP